MSSHEQPNTTKEPGSHGRRRPLLPSVLWSVAAIITAMALGLLLHLAAASHVRRIPEPGTVSGGQYTGALGDDFMVVSDCRWWGEVHQIGWGWQVAEIRDAAGNRLHPPFPDICGRAEILELRKTLPPGPGHLLARASGWPWRTWIQVRTFNPDDLQWSVRSHVRWPAAIGTTALVGFIGLMTFALLRAAWVWVRALVRRGLGACPSCGYDLFGLPADQSPGERQGTVVCPECGATAQVARPARP